MSFFKRYQKGWFAHARARFYRRNVREWCAFGGVGYGGRLYAKYDGTRSYRSGFGFNGYGGLMDIDPSKAFWIARRRARQNNNKFYFITFEEFKKETTY